jgi:transposase
MASVEHINVEADQGAAEQAGIHRVAAEIVPLSDGKLTKLGRVPMLREHLDTFARRELTEDDQVVSEATGNAASVAVLLAPFFDRFIVANPKQVRMLAHAKIKTDAIDAAVPAKLYPSAEPLHSPAVGF